MIYKRLILFLILTTTVFNFIGCIRLDSDTKIKEISMQYLKGKYNEDFEFQDVEVSANEGAGWVYSVYAIPKNNPTMRVEVSSKKGVSDISDDYKEQKWDAVSGEQIKDLIETKFGKITDFRMNFYTIKEIRDKYYLDTNPLDIIKKEANFKKGSLNGNYQPVSERVSVSIEIDKKFNEDDVAKNLINIIQYYNDLNLYFDLDLTFYKKEIYGESNKKGDGSFANVIVTSNTITEKDNIKKLIKYNK